MKLDDYFEAYDRTHDLAGGAPDWETLRKKVRRSLARPALELTGQVVFLLACLALGISGHRISYLLALGALCLIPQYPAGHGPLAPVAGARETQGAAGCRGKRFQQPHGDLQRPDLQLVRPLILPT